MLTGAMSAGLGGDGGGNDGSVGSPGVAAVAVHTAALGRCNGDH